MYTGIIVQAHVLHNSVFLAKQKYYYLYSDYFLSYVLKL